jgi:hypothetical protein
VKGMCISASAPTRAAWQRTDKRDEIHRVSAPVAALEANRWRGSLKPLKHGAAKLKTRGHY